MLPRGSIGRNHAAVATAAALLFATPALAGIVDTPVPLLNGKSAEVVFYVPGVQSTATPRVYDNTGNLDTIFACTSLETKDSLDFTVEVFDYTGAGPVPGYSNVPIVTLKPGETRTICTDPVDGYWIFDGVNPIQNIYGGSARIISTSPKIACDAVIGHTVHGTDQEFPLGPNASLEVVRNSQKGD